MGPIPRGVGLFMFRVASAFLLAFSLTATVAEPVPVLGVVRHGELFELSLIYSEAVDTVSLQTLESYSVTPGELTRSRLAATNQGVILSSANLTANSAGTFSINGVLDETQNPLPPQIIPFDTGNLFWTTIGGSELSLPPEVTAINTNGFDVVSGGIQQKDEYDEATFVGEALTGDFERKVRVAFVEPAGFGAKAGIIVRESLDEGKSRPVDPGDPSQAFSRYVGLFVSAPETAAGEAGQGEHLILQRAQNPSIVTDSLTVTNDAAPAFPDAWLQVKRVGEVFYMSRSTNGVTWESLGSAQFPEAMPETLYVGLSFSPQNDDVPVGSGLRRSFVAKFRDFTRTEQDNRIKIERVGDHAELSWTGNWILQTATTAAGSWENAPSQANPQTVNFSETMRFYRLRR